MKKVLFCLFLTFTTIGTTTTFQACSSPLSLNANNVSNIASKLVSLLGSKIGLNSVQSPLVSTLITQFLGSKLKLGDLLKTNPTQYASQFGGIQGALMTGLKDVFKGNQMDQLMALKPATNDPKNILSQLFF